MATQTAQEVTLNDEQRLYVIPSGSGFSCHGYDVVRDLTVKLRDWLRARYVTNAFSDFIMRDDWTPQVGTLGAYAEYRALCDLGDTYCRQSGQRCDVELTPELIGLEGKRVEVVDRWGGRRRFYVGKSTGWMPIHLEIARRDSTGGIGVSGAPFKSLRVVGQR